MEDSVPPAHNYRFELDYTQRPHAPSDLAGCVRSYGCRVGVGNGFPAPPKWLQKQGRFPGNRGDPSGIDEDVESASHQQLDQKSATSRQTLKALLPQCNSRRLHQLWRSAPAASRRVPSGASLHGVLHSARASSLAPFRTPTACIPLVHRSLAFYVGGPFFVGEPPRKVQRSRGLHRPAAARVLHLSPSGMNQLPPSPLPSPRTEKSIGSHIDVDAGGAETRARPVLPAAPIN